MNRTVFVYEYLSGGGWRDGDGDELLSQGLSMRDAMAADLARVGDGSVSVAACASADTLAAGVTPLRPRAGESAFDFVARQSALHDRVWLVAPETGGLLARFQRIVGDARWMGCSAEAIELTASKRATLAHLAAHGVPTPLDFAHEGLSLPSPLERVSQNSLPLWGRACEGAAGVGATGACKCLISLSAGEPPSQPSPRGGRSNTLSRHPLEGEGSKTMRWVVKPDDGAGGVATRVHTRLDAAVAERDERARAGEAVTLEPWVDGEALSLSLRCTARGAEMLSVNRQHIAVDAQGQLSYEGVSIDALQRGDPRRQPLAGLAARVARAIEGLRGFVGIDLVWHPERGPVVIEVNPRVTCAYVGLSAALGRNLAAELIHNEEADA